MTINPMSLICLQFPNRTPYFSWRGLKLDFLASILGHHWKILLEQCNMDYNFFPAVSIVMKRSEVFEKLGELVPVSKGDLLQQKHELHHHQQQEEQLTLYLLDCLDISSTLQINGWSSEVRHPNKLKFQFQLDQLSLNSFLYIHNIYPFEAHFLLLQRPKSYYHLEISFDHLKKVFR